MAPGAVTEPALRSGVDAFDLTVDEDAPAGPVVRRHTVDLEGDGLARCEGTDRRSRSVRMMIVCPSTTWLTGNTTGRPPCTNPMRPTAVVSRYCQHLMAGNSSNQTTSRLSDPPPVVALIWSPGRRSGAQVQRRPPRRRPPGTKVPIAHAATLSGVRVLLYNAKRYDRTVFDECNVTHGHELSYVRAKLRPTSVDRAGRLRCGLRVRQRRPRRPAVARRLAAARRRPSRCAAPGSTTSTSPPPPRLGITVVRVPAYSPERRRRAHARADPRRSTAGSTGPTTGCATATSRSTGSSASTSTARRPASSAPAGSARSSPGCCGTSRCDVARLRPYADDSLVELGVRYVDLDELWPAQRHHLPELPAHRRHPPPRRRRRHGADASRA